MQSSFIVNATFTSAWEAAGTVTTKCKVNMRTHEVFDIEPAGIDIDDDLLLGEWVTIDGTDYLCDSAESDTEGWQEDVDFWYK